MKTLMGNNRRVEITSQGGFTLIELLVVLSIIASLMVLTAGAIQRYAHRQQLQGATESIVSQMRQVQQRAVAVSHPSVFGVYFSDRTSPGGSDWGPVEYTPDDTATPANETACIPRGERNFDTGSFDSGDLEVLSVFVIPDPVIGPVCQGRIPGADGFVFFFARGDATEATIVISHRRTNDRRTITVSQLTGRVDWSRP